MGLSQDMQPQNLMIYHMLIQHPLYIILTPLIFNSPKSLIASIFPMVSYNGPPSHREFRSKMDLDDSEPPSWLQKSFSNRGFEYLGDSGTPL